MAHDVFISYSTQDKVTADAVCATLEQNGIRCWIAPRDILPGMEYAEALVEALHASRLLVLVFSSGANASMQVRQEVERAVSRGIAILPFRIENVPPNRAMELFIAGRHWLDALTPPMEAHLAELSRIVKLLLSRTDDLNRGTIAPPVPPSPVPPTPVPPGPVVIPAPAPVPNPGPQPVPAPPSGGGSTVVPVAQPILPKWLVMTRKQALGHIRNAWIAGVISAAVTLIVILVSLSGANPIEGMHIDATSFIDLTLMVVFTIGTYRKVRWCAIALFLWFVLEKISQWAQAGVGNALAVILSFAFMYFFFQGMRGASAYRIMKSVWAETA